MFSSPYTLPFILIGVALVGYVLMFLDRARGLWQNSDQFNATEDWTPAPQSGQEPAPIATPLNDWFRRVALRHLEDGETLVGVANGFFWPPRRRDWGIKMGLDHAPVLVGVTSRRILLFDLGFRTVDRFCFIEYDAIRSLTPPKPGILGTTGKLRIDLRSGRAYQIEFRSPLLSDKTMRQERRLAAYLRSIAPRLGSSPAPHSRAA